MLRHDSHPDYESLVKKEQKHRDRQVTMKKRYQSSVAAVEKKKADTLAQVRKETVKKDGELDGLKNLIDSLNSDLSNSKKALNKTLQNKIKAFRRGKIQQKNKSSKLFQLSAKLNRLSMTKNRFIHRSVPFAIRYVNAPQRRRIIANTQNKSFVEVHIFGETYGKMTKRRFKSGIQNI